MDMHMQEVANDYYVISGGINAVHLYNDKRVDGWIARPQSAPRDGVKEVFDTLADARSWAEDWLIAASAKAD